MEKIASIVVGGNVEQVRNFRPAPPSYNYGCRDFILADVKARCECVVVSEKPKTFDLYRTKLSELVAGHVLGQEWISIEVPNFFADRMGYAPITEEVALNLLIQDFRQRFSDAGCTDFLVCGMLSHDAHNSREWLRFGKNYPFKEYYREYRYYDCGGGRMALDEQTLESVLRLSLKSNDSIFYQGGRVAREEHHLLYMKEGAV